MVCIAITGASSGLGLYTCQKLATESEVTKIVFTTRSQAKSDATLDTLVKTTGKDKSFFQGVIMDLLDLNSIEGAVAAFPAVDRLCLNAGGLGQLKRHAESGANDAMVSNVLGHAVLVDGLMGAKKLSAGARVVFVGSEVSRQILSFKGLLPDYMCCFTEDHMKKAIATNYFSFPPLRAQLGDYKNCKIVGQLYFGHLAVKEPKIHWTSTSPGAVLDKRVDFAGHAMFPFGFLSAAIPGFFSCIQVTHPLEEGVDRYVDMLTGPGPKFPTGSMMFSDVQCGCLMWGANSKHMVDNRKFASYLDDPALNEKTYAEVQRVTRDWHSNVGVPKPQTMQI